MSGVKVCLTGTLNEPRSSGALPLRLIAFLVLVVVYSNLLPLRTWWHELFASFGLYLLIVQCALLLPLYRVLRSRRVWFRSFTLILWLIPIAVAILPFIPMYSQPSTVLSEPGTALRILFVPAPLRTSADLLPILTKYTPDVVGAIAPVAGEDTMSQFKYSQSNSFFTLYSKFPLSAATEATLDAGLGPVLLTDIVLQSGKLSLALVTVPLATSPAVYTSNRLVTRRLASLLKHREAPVVLMANLNLSPWSPTYKLFVRAAKFTDLSAGFGFKPTVCRWWGCLPLDFLLARGGVVSRSFDTTAVQGASRTVLLTEVSLPFQP